MEKTNNPWHRQHADGPENTGQRPVSLLWLFATLAGASLYSAMALRLAFRIPNLVQDDARQHVFWMARFRDPTLFPNDLIADYFQAVAPAGYKAVYWIFAKLGVDPLSLSRVLPALIGVLTALLAFQLFVKLSNNSRGAFFAGVIVCQLAWFKDDIVSATPRAFVYPLFLAFLLFLIERRIFACLLVLAAEGLVYPQAALVSLGVLELGIFDWKERHFLARDRNAWILAITGTTVLAIVLTVFATGVSRYGPVISPAEARSLPEFLKHGRSQFFTGGVGFWLTGARSGFWPGAVPEYLLILGLLGAAVLMFGRRILALNPLSGRSALFLRIVVASLVLWAAAHLFLFKLHLPARYSHWSLRILLGLTAAVALMSILAAMESWRTRCRSAYARGAISALLYCMIASVIFAPLATREFPSATFVQSKPAELYEFLERQPKGVVIATLDENGSKIPVFSHRSILVSAEHAIPYHTGYYHQIRQRGRDLVFALLTPNAAELRAFIEKYHVDLIIVSRKPVTLDNIKDLRWFGEIVTVSELNRNFGHNQSPAISTMIDRCKLIESGRDIVLDAHLIAQTISANENPPSP